MSKNKSKILYIGNKNNKFVQRLSALFRVEQYKYILPNIFKDKLGHLNFSNLDYYKDYEWENALGFKNNYFDIVYHFGIDPINYDEETKIYYLKKCIQDLFLKLGLKVSGQKTIQKILETSITKSIFLKEEELDQFEIIIVEDWVELIYNFDKQPKSVVDVFEHSKDFHIPYINYKLTGQIVENLFLKNKKIIFLYGDVFSYDNFYDALFRFKKINFMLNVTCFDFWKNIKPVEILGTFRIPEQISEHLITAIDDKFYTGNTTLSFKIELNEKYLTKVSSKFKKLYSKDSSLGVEKVIQLESNFHNKESSILKGNLKSTFLYPVNFFNNNLIELNREDSLDKEPKFGDLNLQNERYYCVLTGNFVSDKYITDNLFSNYSFIVNIINYLLKFQSRKIHQKLLLPELTIDYQQGKIFINGIDTKLKPMQFAYYAFFIENNLNQDLWVDLYSERSEILNKRKLFIKIEHFDSIIRIHQKSFSGNGNINRAEKLLLNNQTVSNQDFNSIKSYIKKALYAALADYLEAHIIEKFLIKNRSRNIKLFGIDIPSEKIKVIYKKN